MKNNFRITCTLILFIIVQTEDDFNFDGIISHKWQIEHSFQPDNSILFKPKGKITLKFGQKYQGYFIPNEKLLNEDLNLLKECVINDCFYRIHVYNDTTDVYGLTKARFLFQNGFNELLRLSVSNSGSLIGVSVTTQPQTVNDLGGFKQQTIVEVETYSQAPVPDTQLYVQKIEEEKQQKAKGTEKENKSFFSKYWMYIAVAVVLLMFIQQTDPNQAAGGARN